MWLLRILGVLVAVAVLAVVALLLLPGDRIAAIAVDQIKARTGRDLVIEGDVAITFWPVLGVETGPVTLSNAAWAGPEPMLRAKGLSIGIAAPDLLQGRLRVQRIAAEAPDLRLERDRNGRGNWEFTAPAASAPGGDSGGQNTPVALERLSLTDARLTYAEAGQAPVVVDVAALDLQWPDPGAPVQIDATLRPYGDPVRIVAQIDGFDAFLGGAVAPVTAKLTLPGGEVGFDGRADTSGNAAGRVTVAATDTARMLAALGQPGTTLPKGLGQAAQVTTTATHTADGKLALRDLALQLDQNRLTGAADIALGEPLRVTAQLRAGALDFTSLTQGGGPASAPAGSGWSTDPIDASALGLIDGSIALEADSIDTGTVRLGPVKAVLEIDRSRAVLRLDPVSVFGGTLTGRLVANNRKGLSVAGKLQAKGIEMQDALGRLAGIERLSGKAAGDLEFLGSGKSVDAIMRSLTGAGALRMKGGVIAGIDLDQLLRTGSGTGGTTVFDSLTATYAIAAGDLLNDDLVLKLSRFQAEGAGRIGLGAQDIDYLFTPVAIEDASGKRLAISVRIVGPWANPRIKPDLSDALDAEIEVRRDELEQKAKAKIEQKLQEELDVTVQEGQSVEDAVKDKLEDEARKGLLKLLGAD